MRGYAGIWLPLSACVHFVRNDEIDDSLIEMVEDLREKKITWAYVDYEIVSKSGANIADHIARVLRLEHAPYGGPPYGGPCSQGVGIHWVRFLDDLITLSSHVTGVVIVIDNADLLFAEARNDAFDLVESFLIQFHHWLEKKKPCHLCFQMERNELIGRAFSPASP